MNLTDLGWSDLEDFLIDTNNSISYLVIADLDRIGCNFSKVDREISRLKDNYEINILPARKGIGLKSALRKGIKKKKSYRKICL